MKARNPKDGRWYFFFDKCLSFGGSSSCAIFQKISDCIKHIVKFRTSKDLVNYLDDYFFVALIKLVCDRQIKVFIRTCEEIGMPVAFEKTFWGQTVLTFLGYLLDTVNQQIGIPIEKLVKAREMIDYVINKRDRKITVHHLQKICGFLNFLCGAVVPGRAFTRRLYMYLEGNLKPYHHIKVDVEIIEDLKMWKVFIDNPRIFNRPFLDHDKTMTPEEIDWYTDSSKNANLGFRRKMSEFVVCF